MAIEPTVRLETSSGATRFTTANTSSAATANENLQHYPLAAAHFVDQVPLSSTVNEKALFKKRLVANYPAKYILFLALAILLLNFFILYCEISLNQLRYYQYNVYFVSKYAVITSLTNNLYAIMALISTKFRNYFFIQLVSLLHLVGFFATGFFSVFLNVMSFMLIVMENTCQGHCILIETLTLVAAFISAVFSMALFIKLQFNFLPNLNKNIFTSTSTSS